MRISFVLVALFALLLLPGCSSPSCPPGGREVLAAQQSAPGLLRPDAVNVTQDDLETFPPLGTLLSQWNGQTTDQWYELPASRQEAKAIVVALQGRVPERAWPNSETVGIRYNGYVFDVWVTTRPCA